MIENICALQYKIFVTMQCYARYRYMLSGGKCPSVHKTPVLYLNS